VYYQHAVLQSHVCASVKLPPAVELGGTQSGDIHTREYLIVDVMVGGVDIHQRHRNEEDGKREHHAERKATPQVAEGSFLLLVGLACHVACLIKNRDPIAGRPHGLDDRPRADYPCVVPNRSHIRRKVDNCVKNPFSSVSRVRILWAQLEQAILVSTSFISASDWCEASPKVLVVRWSAPYSA
jgi:hypothetical protein